MTNNNSHKLDTMKLHWTTLNPLRTLSYISCFGYS